MADLAWIADSRAYVLKKDSAVKVTGKAETMAKGRFAFHDTLVSRSGVIAAVQGGPIWLFDEQGNARARLDDAGTTAFRMEARGDELLVGRMNRVVQRIAIA